MHYTDLRNIKRGVFILVLISVSLAYMQVVTMDQWDRFVHFRILISRRMDFSGGEDVGNTDDLETDRDIEYLGDHNATNLTYIDYESVGDTIINSAEDRIYLDEFDTAINLTYYETGPFNDTNTFTGDTIEASSETMNEEMHAKQKNKFATINLKQFVNNESNFADKPLLILFSSWVASPEKAHVHAILKHLWNSWPSIKPLVMSKNKTIQTEFFKDGWLYQTLTNINSRCYGPPVLATMFTDVFKKHDAYFYGYSNADIIFGQGLEDTMKFLYYYFSPWKNKPVLVIGRRHNVDFVKHENVTLKTPKDVRDVTKVGKLVIRSTDYFITNRHFPWGQAPKVTIGRPYVVRAIIGWALQKSFYVIDATRTIESVHLTTEDGVFASWHKKGTMCNEYVLALLHWNIPTFLGHCECARLETYYGRNKTIKLRARPPSDKYCRRNS